MTHRSSRSEQRLALGGRLLVALLILPACLASAPLAEREPDVLDARGADTAAVEEPREVLDAHLARARAAVAVLAGYRAELVKEERVGERLYAPQRMQCKVRHEPFAVYLRFLEPSALEGQEALWAGERYGGELVARAAGAAGFLGAQVIDPEGGLAMRGNRYPITETGMARLLEKVDALLAQGDGPGAIAELRLLEGAEVDGRACSGVEAQFGQDAPFALVRLYFDDAWGLPVAYEAFEVHEGALRLAERYAYEALEVDVELGDADFDRANEAYRLR